MAYAGKRQGFTDYEIRGFKKIRGRSTESDLWDLLAGGYNTSAWLSSLSFVLPFQSPNHVIPESFSLVTPAAAQPRVIPTAFGGSRGF